MLVTLKFKEAFESTAEWPPKDVQLICSMSSRTSLKKFSPVTDLMAGFGPLIGLEYSLWPRCFISHTALDVRSIFQMKIERNRVM